jgi:drug/metabolite transporter (DMT)-like permease
MNLTDKQKGIFLSLIGVLIITPDSLFIRLINIPSWELLFYRGLIPSFFLFIFLLLYYKKNFLHSLLITGLPGLLYAVLIALGNTAFVLSIQNTNVANTLIMIALTPFATAILSSIFIKEHPSKRMWVTIIACFVTILFIFYESYQGGRLFGDFFGLLTAIFVGGSAVVIRFSKLIDLLPALLMAKLFTLVIPLVFLNSFNELFFIDSDQLFFIIVMGLFLVIPLACMTIAPRFIPAYEVEIFFILETILGPIWVWFVIHEQPSIKTIIGGIVIILIIITHTIFELLENRKIS